MLDEIIADERLTARGGYGFWHARADGDDIVVASRGAAVELRLPMLRQQTVKPEDRPNRCLADYLADG